MHASRSILWLALAVATPALAQQNLSKVSGDITTQAGQQYGALSSVSGDVHVAGNVQAAGVHTVSGDIRIDSGATIGNVGNTSGNIKAADNVKLADLKTVSGNIQLGREVQVNGDVATVSGDIFTDRGTHITGAINSVSGSIGLVQTVVDGGITFASSDLTVGVDSHVKGRIYLKKPNFSHLDHPPRIVIGPQVVVDGPLDFELPVQLYVHSSAKTGKITGATPIAFSSATPPK
ncbi:hypothetical protein P6166_07240 [Stenotrophomonas sp. HITSZ_GD]|uniref:DUF4097 family beta strand repeat-containing protein n=1 Tax=Stenotrophomonas sp. HITSZ_GD TaxID=3037248 RepID=UPI00240D2727|nr:hypothetical protein [Stenotrophomonas sp. HITSZ_GD]MDG2525147.1 hypothetical protein [Stenotrophomonas sp. HITSZ_GD]